MFDLSKTYLIDGAMGTMLQRSGLCGLSESYNLLDPDAIRRIHLSYIDAGADIIETNSFSANRISLGPHGLAEKAGEYAFAAARTAREAADGAGRKVYVAGSMGPTTKSLSIASNVSQPWAREISFDEMAEAYREQIDALTNGGADFLLLETSTDALNAKAAIYSYLKLGAKIPIAISVSCSDRSGRTLSGQTIRAFYESIRHARPEAFGLNCSMGAAGLRPLIKEVSAFAECATLCYPNAGLPNEMGGYDETPGKMAEEIAGILSDGSANIVGGCCGSTPAHIAAIKAILPPDSGRRAAGCGDGLEANGLRVSDCGQRTPDSSRRAADCGDGLETSELRVSDCGQRTPDSGRRAADRADGLETSGQQTAGDSSRKAAVRPGGLVASGLEPVEIDSKRFNFTNIGERTNVAGSRKFARLIAEGNTDEALGVAASQIEGGARVIDINMDDAMLDAPLEMAKFVRSIQSAPEVARAALMIDSSDFNAILAGLKNAQGKCIVNSLSLKEGEKAFLEKASEVRSLGAATVVMAFDENGQATNFETKTAIAARAYKLLTENWFNPEDIIFDAGILSIGTGDESDRRYAVDFIEAVRWIKANLPGMLTSGGVSNLSFAFRGNNPVREAMHSVFLYHAVKAGLDMAIVNPGALKPFTEIDESLREAIEDVIFNRREDASERLLAIASKFGKEEKIIEIKSEETPKDIREILVKGKPEGLEAALEEELKRLGDARKVIEGPLMEGMERVGKMFEEGKMFLPQVIKSAKTMKQAVSYLTPLLSAGPDEAGSGKPLIVIATVKGDIHDIGKNITSTVLGCNGFEVEDLGVDVDCSKIIDEAVRLDAAVICASGLITPSLKKMEELCAAMAARGLRTPLLIGGATTSELHTAVKLAPLYPHVFYCADASATSVLARKLLAEREETEKVLHQKQEALRGLYSRRGTESPEPTGKLFDYLPTEGFAPEGDYPEIAAGEAPLGEIAALIDWKLFLSIWKIKGSDYGRAEVEDILREARERLASLKASVRCALHFTAVPGCEAPELGLFAAAVHSCGCPCCDSEDYLGRTLRMTLAEAAADWMEKKISVPAGYKLIRPAVGYPSCPDHSLKKTILELIPDSEKLGIGLSESFAMSPEASVCGFFVIHKDARYL